MRTLASLISMAPRCPMDERGATPWTSFRREVAVARTISDRAAAADIRAAQRLTTVLPQTMHLLEQGSITEQRARVFLTELEVYDDELACQLDSDLADRVAALPAWRIVQDVRRAAQVLDPDAAALRTATKTAGRGVLFQPDADDQASVTLFGTGVPLTRWYGTLDARARSLKQAGDGRTLDDLRFDLATNDLPCAVHRPAAPDAGDAGPRGRGTDIFDDAEPAPDTLDDESRPGSDAAVSDCRRTRPVQAMVVVPVETALGLSAEPGWLDGYGWVGAPTVRQLLVDAELRRVCAQAGTGQLVDLAVRDVRPQPTPEGVRTALLDMVLARSASARPRGRNEAQHDPSPALRTFATLRDRSCDGPTGSRSPASVCDLDHDTPHPIGPTAAWNLVARAQRTHQLKHYGWTPLRTPSATLWMSPAGQVVEVPRHTIPPPGVDADTDVAPAELPDAGALQELDRAQLTAPAAQDLPPWLPEQEPLPDVDWTWLSTDEAAAPF